MDENQGPGALSGKQRKRQQRAPPWSSRKTPPDRKVSKHQEEPLEEMQEDTTGEEMSVGPVWPPERTRSQKGTKTRENSLGCKGRASRRPQGGEAEKNTPDRGGDKLSGKYIKELRKGSRKEHQEEPSEERQEGSLKGKDGRRRGAEALGRLPGYLAGPGGGGAPRLGGTRRDPGEGVGTEQHKD